MMTKRAEFFKNLLGEGFALMKSSKKLSEAIDPVNTAMTEAPPLPPPMAPPAPTNAPPEVPVAQQNVGGQGQPPLTIDTIITKLNMIRRGRSFNDSPMHDQLSDFFNTLTEPDKATLDRLLSQIGQIVVSNLPQPTSPTLATPAPGPQTPPPPVVSPTNAPPVPPQGPIG
jgi:hypothetical protein